MFSAKGLISCRFYSTALKTCLHDLHLQLGAKMTDFAGYSMPLLYKTHSIVDSHNWTRKNCGLFDVSHMFQFKISGKDRYDLMHSLVVADINSLPNNASTLSVFTNENGGIMDDTIISNCRDDDNFYIVSNAGCRDKIKKHLENAISKFQAENKDVVMEPINNGLIALQGPAMKSVLQAGVDFSLEDDLYFGAGRYCTVYGIDNCRVTRCGYTGEDGVEISVPEDRSVELAEKLLLDKLVIPVGLGARDTLRLEAGLCLYGNDIDENTTPSEAALSWTIGKARKTAGEKDVKFAGYDRIMSQVNKSNPISRFRVGLTSAKGPPARTGAEILSPQEEPIGAVTSGCFSPYLSKNIAMGYVKRGYFKSGTEVLFKIRGKIYPASIVKLPFVPTNYHFPARK